jgi:ubiquitin-conjugating enzyme E2 Q
MNVVLPPIGFVSNLLRSLDKKAMEQVEAWITNGAANSEGFFVDEDASPAPEGSACLSVGGMFNFDLLLSSPFTVTPRASGSKALASFHAGVNKAPAPASIAEALTRATKEYKRIADALDAENAGEIEEEVADEGDAFDEMNAEVVRRAAEEARKRKEEMAAELDRLNAQYDLTGLTKATVDRILSDYDKVLKAKPTGWSASPDGRNLSKWKVELNNFEKGTGLFKDMEELKRRTGRNTIDMEMTFPKEYPFKPPFIRVLRPRFMPRTGRVTVGGSICTELLTDDGWKPVYDIESILETIRQQITDPESGAKLDHSNTTDYSMAEAQEAFHRVAQYHKEHGW